MNIHNYSDSVRVINYGNPLQVEYNIVVERLVDGQWTMYWRGNTFTNDWALSEASRIARELANVDVSEAMKVALEVRKDLEELYKIGIAITRQMLTYPETHASEMKEFRDGGMKIHEIADWVRLHT